MLSTVTIIVPPASSGESNRVTILDRKHLTIDDLGHGWAFRRMREKIDLDLLSYDISGKSGLWFVIADINNILDPFIDIEANESLIIPTKQSFDDVNSMLSRRG